MENSEILKHLERLHKELNMNRYLTEYTANEGRRDANNAISLVKKWKVDESNNEVKELINSTISELTLAVKAADKYYENYDFSKRKHNSQAAQPFESVIKAQHAIEKFIYFIKDYV